MAKAKIIYHTTDTDLDEDQAVELEVDVLALTGDQITDPVAGIRLPVDVVAAGWRVFKSKYACKNVSRLGYTVSALDCTSAEIEHVQQALRTRVLLEISSINANILSLNGVVGAELLSEVVIMDEVPHPRDCSA